MQARFFQTHLFADICSVSTYGAYGNIKKVCDLLTSLVASYHCADKHLLWSQAILCSKFVHEIGMIPLKFFFEFGQ